MNDKIEEEKSSPPKCPLCGEDWGKHEKEKKTCPNANESGRPCGWKQVNGCGWTNKATGPKLNTRIRTASKLEAKVYTNSNLEAHHLICKEAMKDDKWARVCQLTGYNINCYLNGVRLPNQLDQACVFKVPLHEGGHSAGYGGDASDNYPKAVMNEINDILNRYYKKKVCKIKLEESKKAELKKLVDELNGKSNEIFGKIKKFEWTITWDGFDYMEDNPIGCSNRETISEKRGKWERKKGEWICTPHTDVQIELSKNREKTIETIKTIEEDREKLKDLFNDLKNDEKSIIKCPKERYHPKLHDKLLKEQYYNII